MTRTTSTQPKDAIHDRWVFIGLLALLLWAPLPLGSNRVWGIGILLVFAVLLLLGTLLAWAPHAVQAVARLKPFQWPIGLLVCMLLLCWGQTLHLPAAWVAAISPLAAAAQAPAQDMYLSLDVAQSYVRATLAFIYLTAFVVSVLAVRDAQRLDRLAMVLVCGGLLQAVIGAVLFSTNATYRIFFVDVSHARFVGSYVYQNSTAGYLCMCLSVGIGLMLSRLDGNSQQHANWQSKLRAAIAFVLSPSMRLRMYLVVMVIALVLTRSRMGNTAFFAAMLVMGGLAIVLARKTAPKTIALIISLIIIDVLVVGTGVGLEKVVARIEATELRTADGGLAESVEARTEAARVSLPIVKDFALVGSGGGSFYNIFMSYRTPTYGHWFLDHAHNDFVEIATDYGLVGLGILGLLVALSFGTALRVMATRKSRLPWGIAFGVAMAMVALAIHSTVDFNLQIPANALTMVVILSMGWIAKNLPSAGNNRSFKDDSTSKPRGS